MSEIIIFCESYPQIKSAICLAQENYQKNHVTVIITGIEPILKFFNLVNEKYFQNRIKIIFFGSYRGRLASTSSRLVKALYIIPEVLKEKRYLKQNFTNYFAHIKNAEIFFFSRYFNPSTYYLLRRLDETNHLLYIPEPTYDALKMDKITSAKVSDLAYGLAYLIMCRLIYSRDINVSKHPIGQITTCMPDSFFKKLVTKCFSKEERDNLLRNFNPSQFRFFPDKDYRVMYFHEDLVEQDYIADTKVFEKLLIEAISIIGKYFKPNQIALKYHPASGEKRTIFPIGEVLPDFIPAEFLFDDKIQIYISISTQALANVEKGTVISLIDQIGFKNDIIGARLKQSLNVWSRTKIKFPKSLEEFEKILIDSKSSGFDGG